jgi:hypothetical protein
MKLPSAEIVLESLIWFAAGGLLAFVLFCLFDLWIG